MQLLKETRYGVRLMIALSFYYGKRTMLMQDIATRLNISKNYLEKIANKLRRAKLIVGYRGRNGGYTLSKPPCQITVGDMVRSLEERVSLTRCLSDQDACSKVKTCKMRSVWQEGERAMFTVFDSITLESLAENMDESCLAEEQTKAVPCGVLDKV
ncbi:MAG: Rrf2 family transcriptional regulator [Bilophila sp.]